MPIKATCSCGQSFQAPDKLAGKQVKCPSCGGALAIPSPQVASSIAVACQCGKSFQAKPELAGKTVNCPSCSQPLTISAGPAPTDNPLGLGNMGADPLGGQPSVDPLAADPLAAGGYGSYGPGPTQPAPSRKPSQAGSKKKLIIGLSIGGGVIVVAVVVLIIVLGGSKKKNNNTTASNNVPSNNASGNKGNNASGNNGGGDDGKTPTKSPGEGDPNKAKSTNKSSEKTPKATSGSATELAGTPYVIRPPSNYEPISTPQTPPNTKLFGWKGKDRQDGTAAQLLVIIVTDARAAQVTPQRSMESILGATRRGKSNWKQTEVEKVTLNGIPFLRVVWQGELRPLGAMKGFAYATVHDGQVIRITSQDVEAHADALTVANKAALTFATK